MDRLLTMTVFRRVAELESFSAAARELGLSNAAVSKHVALLEERLRARLLQRTTRSVALTSVGEAYLARAARLLDEVDELDQSVTQSTTTPKGLLRVNAPAAFGLQYVSAMLPPLLARWPELKLDVSFTDRFVDLVEEGVDVVLRIASELPDSATLVAQRLVGTEQIVCATPRYLRARGTPRSPDELAAHDCIVYSGRPDWTFAGPDGPVRLRPEARLRVDSSLAIRDALVAGAGIALIPVFYVDELVRARKLRVVLSEFPSPVAWVHAVYPRQRHLSTKIRVFIDHVREALAAQPWAVPPR